METKQQWWWRQWWNGSYDEKKMQICVIQALVVIGILFVFFFAHDSSFSNKLKMKININANNEISMYVSWVRSQWRNGWHDIDQWGNNLIIFNKI